MIFILLFLWIFSAELNASAYSRLTFWKEQREEAEQFISTCFNKIKHVLDIQIAQLKVEKKLAEEEVRLMLKSGSQVNNVEFVTLAQYSSDLKDNLKSVKTYLTSLSRPQSKIAQWKTEHETIAYDLYSFMLVGKEFEAYEKAPSDQKIYAQLHNRLLEVACFLIDHTKESFRCFSAGNHAQSGEDDSEIDYNVDRVVFLALYLLNQSL